MNTPDIAAFLSAPEQVALAQRHDPDFQGFLAVALKSSGEQAHKLDVSTSRFRIVDGRLGTLDDLQIDDMVSVAGQPVAIRELIDSSLTIDRVHLIHSLWRLDSFEQVKTWLGAMRVLVRFAYDMEGQLQGHLLLAETIIPMVETVERKEYVLPNGDMASDAITRNYGVRAKVFALDRASRSTRAQDNNTIMDRLSRTFSKVNR